MPLSLIPTFAVMAAFNISLNNITLLALSLVVGILVDDAIVEIENIVRHMRQTGSSAYQAAIEAADEIGLAVVATTATIVAVFLPVAFMPGIPGKFFFSFAIAVCVSVLFSLLVARMLTPLMGAYLLRSDDKHGEDKPFWMDGYQKLLHWCLSGHVRWGAVVLFHGVVIALVLITVALTKAAIVPGVLAAVVLVAAAVLAILSGRNHMKARWALLEIGVLFALVWAMIGFGMLAGPVMTAAKTAAPHGQAAVKAAVEAAKHAPNPMAVPGMIVMAVGALILIGAIFLCAKFKTSYINARWAVVIVGIVFFIGSIALTMAIPQENITAADV